MCLRFGLILFGVPFAWGVVGFVSYRFHYGLGVGLIRLGLVGLCGLYGLFALCLDLGVLVFLGFTRFWGVSD